MSEKTITIKSNEKKVSLHLIESPSRHGWMDYGVRVYGDGPADDLPGATPFKVFTFPVSHEVEHPESRFWDKQTQKQFYQKYSDEKKEEALHFIDEQVKHYQSVLGENSKVIEHTSLLEHLTQLKEKIIPQTDEKKNNKNKM